MKALIPLLLIAVLSLSSCTVVGPDHVPPEVSLPGAFHESDARLAAESVDLSAFWTAFNDPMLTSLVARARANNRDVARSLAAIAEARALYEATGADLRPQVQFGADYRHSQESETTAFGTFRTFRTSEQVTVGVDASWEIDLFGRFARTREAALADFDGAVEASAAVYSSLAAECARTYIELRVAEARLRVIRKNLTIQNRTATLATDRYDAGLAPKSDMLSSQSTAKRTASTLPAVEALVRNAENRLAVLLGQMPGTLAEELAAPGPIPTPPVSIAVGLPADLLRRRPDLRQAERAIAKETALVGVATADLYPSFSLIGNLGLQSEKLSDLFTGASTIYGIGPSISFNLFDRDRTHRLIEAQESRRAQAILRYEATVLNAVEEAESAMTRLVRSQARRDLLSESLSFAEEALVVATAQYESGLSDYLVILEAERSLAQIEDEMVLVDGDISLAAVSLYKALGGGDPGRTGSDVDVP